MSKTSIVFQIGGRPQIKVRVTLITGALTIGALTIGGLP